MERNVSFSYISRQPYWCYGGKACCIEKWFVSTCHGLCDFENSLSLIEQNVQALYRELAAQLSTLRDNAITSNAIHLLYSTN